MLHDFSESDASSSGDEADHQQEQVKRKSKISYNDLQAHGFRGPAVLELPKSKSEKVRPESDSPNPSKG